MPVINIFGLCKLLGIEHVIKMDASDQAELEKVIKEKVARKTISVIITKVPCALLKGIKLPNGCRPVPDRCGRRDVCLRPGCLAFTEDEDGLISIDEATRNDCGLCM